MLKAIKNVIFVCCITFASVVWAEDEIYDPWESYNRAMFDFNDYLDVHVAEPVAQGYDYILPRGVKKGVSNFFENISYPKYLLSDLIQLKFSQVLKHTGRFLVNSTVGVAGLFDVAEDWGLPHHYEDIGVALAYQGVPSGPYLMLPLLGPTTVRDGFGKVVEFFISPWYWFDTYTDLSWEWDWTVTSSATVLDFVDTRYTMLEAIKAAKDSSVDYYLFAQSSYYQYRNALVKDHYGDKQESQVSESGIEADSDDDWLNGDTDDDFVN